MSGTKKSEGESRLGLKDDEMAAVIVAGSIVVFFAVYWFFEIMSVRELLEMAYGLSLNSALSRVNETIRNAKIALRNSDTQ